MTMTDVPGVRSVAWGPVARAMPAIPKLNGASRQPRWYGVMPYWLTALCAGERLVGATGR